MMIFRTSVFIDMSTDVNENAGNLATLLLKSTTVARSALLQLQQCRGRSNTRKVNRLN